MHNLSACLMQAKRQKKQVASAVVQRGSNGSDSDFDLDDL